MWLVALALGACFSKPPPPCTTAVALPFTTVADDCTPWGLARGNGAFHQGGGVLTLTPNPSSSVTCDLSTPTSFGEGGIFVEVEPDLAPAATTQFSIGVNGSNNPQMGVTDGMLRIDETFNPNAAFRHDTPYDHDAMHWWRFVPGPPKPADPTRHGVIAQVSPDGQTWTDVLAIDPDDLPSEDQALSSAGFQLASSNGNTAGSAEFRSVDICPD